MRERRDLLRHDEWPNLHELDTRARFTDGEPVTPLERPRPPGSFGVAVLFILFLVAVMGALLISSRADADAPEIIYQHVSADNELQCTISTDLRVSGPHRTACVDRLDVATRLARGEMRVNKAR